MTVGRSVQPSCKEPTLLQGGRERITLSRVQTSLQQVKTIEPHEGKRLSLARVCYSMAKESLRGYQLSE